MKTLKHNKKKGNAMPKTWLNFHFGAMLLASSIAITSCKPIRLMEEMADNVGKMNTKMDALSKDMKEMKEPVVKMIDKADPLLDFATDMTVKMEEHGTTEKLLDMVDLAHPMMQILTEHDTTKKVAELIDKISDSDLIAISIELLQKIKKQGLVDKAAKMLLTMDEQKLVEKAVSLINMIVDKKILENTADLLQTTKDHDLVAKAAKAMDKLDSSDLLNKAVALIDLIIQRGLIEKAGDMIDDVNEKQLLVDASTVLKDVIGRNIISRADKTLSDVEETGIIKKASDALDDAIPMLRELRNGEAIKKILEILDLSEPVLRSLKPERIDQILTHLDDAMNSLQGLLDDEDLEKLIEHFAKFVDAVIDDDGSFNFDGLIEEICQDVQKSAAGDILESLLGIQKINSTTMAEILLGEGHPVSRYAAIGKIVSLGEWDEIAAFTGIDGQIFHSRSKKRPFTPQNLYIDPVTDRLVTKDNSSGEILEPGNLANISSDNYTKGIPWMEELIGKLEKANLDDLPDEYREYAQELITTKTNLQLFRDGTNGGFSPTVIEWMFGASGAIKAMMQHQNFIHLPRFSGEILDRAGIVATFLLNQLANDPGVYDKILKLAAFVGHITTVYSPGNNFKVQGLEHQSFLMIEWYAHQMACEYKELSQMVMAYNITQPECQWITTDEKTIKDLQYLPQLLLESAKRYYRKRGYGPDASEKDRKKLYTRNFDREGTRRQELDSSQTYGWIYDPDWYMFKEWPSIFGDECVDKLTEGYSNRMSRVLMDADPKLREDDVKPTVQAEAKEKAAVMCEYFKRENHCNELSDYVSDGDFTGPQGVPDGVPDIDFPSDKKDKTIKKKRKTKV
jgi:outer membrane murein-binding lipoprotein Lpp